MLRNAFSAVLVLLTAWGSARGQLEVSPKAVKLWGSDGSAQIVAVLRGERGDERDVTARVRYESSDPGVAAVDARGHIVAVGDGRARITVESESDSRVIDVEVADTADSRPLGFVGSIVPILSRFGCNSGACHGKATGQNGFRLSLLGFDPAFDFEAIVREGRGRRVVPSDPERSLVLLKPTARIPHGGGRRFEVDSPEHRTIARWIRGGMRMDVSGEPILVGLEAIPAQRMLRPGEAQQVRVEARYSDGSVVDVTRLAQYHSNTPDLATVDDRGEIQALDGVGVASVMVRYGGEVSVVRATVPRVGETIAEVESSRQNPIDAFVLAQLRALNIPASPPCSDAEFARRSSVDIRGMLPSPAEVAALEQDAASDKRARWIDRLLGEPEYADYFAMKWSAILRNSRGPQIFGENGRETTFAFHAWLRQAIAQNMPYDKFAAALVAAKGNPSHNPAVAWYRTRDFGGGSTEAIVEDTAQLFLGMRIQCAKCHHHPFERWSQDDYYGFTSVFSRIGKKASDDPFTPQLFTLARGKARHPSKGTEYEPKALGGPEFKGLGPRDDPRERLAAWMVEPGNPYFAPALVNRYWKHFMGVGLVEPEDDMRVSNPASNPELLDFLSAEFARGGFDAKALIRLIVTSEAYSRSSMPQEANERDRQNYARFYPRRLPAEVLLDAIDAVTDMREEYPGMPAGFRAVQLPDESFSSYFLQVFGRPKRESVCECERTSEPSLAQRLHLLNSDDIENKVRGARAERLAHEAEERPEMDASHVEQLYRLAYSRPPGDDEREACLAHLARARAHGALKDGYEDLIWTLINSNEFLFNH